MSIKRLMSLLFIAFFVIALCPAVFAQTYNVNVDETILTFDLPDTWQVATRNDYDEEFVKQYCSDPKEWTTSMQRSDSYLFAALPSDSEAQHEITITAERSAEPIDYDEAYNFELNLTAKASFEGNPSSSRKYTSYSVAQGKNTKFLVFDYTDTYTDSDKVSKPYYGKLYHTVMDGMSIEFDLSSYKELTNDYLSAFDNAVLGAGFTKMSPDSSARLKRNLVYLALIVLAVSFVAVIVIFIVSKIKEKKQFDRAAEEALRAQREAKEMEEARETEEAETDETSGDNE